MSNSVFKALHFGAGNIGRGFIGKVLAEAGAEVVFTDVVAETIKALNERKTFNVRVVGEKEHVDVVKIKGAVMSGTDDLDDEIVKADLITTAVGPNILAVIAPKLAKGLEKRRFLTLAKGSTGKIAPVNIIACENAIRASTTLKDHVLKNLSPETVAWAKGNVGFVDCAVDRIVPATVKPEDKLEVTVEDFCEWVVDSTQFVKSDSLPQIASIKYTDNLMAFVERKLMTLNTGHAICAYLGHLSGHAEVQDAIVDPRIRKVVEGAMTESGRVLVQRYKFNPEEHAAYIQRVLKRFENPHIHDVVTRVGRDPIRKLSSNDRLVKPLLGCLEYKLPCDNLIVGIAAALLFNDPTDGAAMRLQELIKAKGPKGALIEVSGLKFEADNNTTFKTQDVVDVYDTLKLAPQLAPV